MQYCSEVSTERDRMLARGICQLWLGVYSSRYSCSHCYLDAGVKPTAVAKAAPLGLPPISTLRARRS